MILKILLETHNNISGFHAAISKGDEIFWRKKIWCLFMFSKSMKMYGFWRVSITLTALDFATKPNLD